MSLAIQLKKLQMFRDWLQNQQEYEGRDQAAEQWQEFIQMMESDKALNRLAESYGAESFNVEFNEWADQEMKSHGKNVSFKDWADDEGLKHGDMPIMEWAEHEEESHDARYGAESYIDEPFYSIIKMDERGIDYSWGIEDHDTLDDAIKAYDDYNQNLKGKYIIMENDNEGEGDWKEVKGFCAECGGSHKDAETFSAETADGNQVFNSCWKCGSGQHLHQISRYPASPDEIAGVGANPEDANEGWQSARPTQR